MVGIRSSAVDLTMKGPAQRSRHQRPVVTKPYLMRYVGKPCPYCSRTMYDRGRHMVSRDHILSRSLMAETPNREQLWAFNSIIVCDWCNQEKGKMRLFEFSLIQTVGAPRDIALRALFDRLRRELPHDVFIALTGLPR